MDDRLLTEAVAPMLEALSREGDVRGPLARRFGMNRWFAAQVSVERSTGGGQGGGEQGRAVPGEQPREKRGYSYSHSCSHSMHSMDQGGHSDTHPPTTLALPLSRAGHCAGTACARPRPPDGHPPCPLGALLQVRLHAGRLCRLGVRGGRLLAGLAATAGGWLCMGLG